MTIHKSKGLGFDLVLLPDLEGTRLDYRRDGLAVQKSADRTLEWVLDVPGKLFHMQDEVLLRTCDLRRLMPATRVFRSFMLQ